MRSRPAAGFMVLAVLACVGLLAGCGSSKSKSSSGSGTTKTAPSRGLSAEPIERGLYAGVKCNDERCANFAEAVRYAELYCKGGGHLGKPVELPTDFRTLSFICFRLIPANPTQTSATPNLVKDFYIRTQLVLGQGHVASDTFNASDNGWKVNGEWFGPTEVKGTYTNPSGTSARYQARWYASS
jgi:hypothetical protein